MDSLAALRIYRTLFQRYHEAVENDNNSREPFLILITTILSAQTTDRTVEALTPALFTRYPTPHALASAKKEEVESFIRPTGFYHVKARHIIETARILATEMGGEVPRSMDILLSLPGVGRKTANIVLSHAYKINDGIAVDTHVQRIARRIGLSYQEDTEMIEQDLTRLYPRKLWGTVNSLFIAHGRALCRARKPLCPECPVRGDCQYFREQLSDKGDP